jgi:hypothetical protein
MAIIAATEFRGIPLPAAYLRIDRVETRRAQRYDEAQKNEHQVTVAVYADQQAYEDGEQPLGLDDHTLPYDPTQTVSFESLYLWLAAEKYTDAVEDGEPEAVAPVVVDDVIADSKPTLWQRMFG